MGKIGDQQLPVALQQLPPPFRRGWNCRLISFKCAVVLTLSAAAFVSALFCVLPLRHRQAGFDAKESIKLNATVQANFRLHKPVSKLIPHVARLEYDLNGEIGVPSSKVVILSMHQDGKSNWSDVVFGFLPDPIDITMNPVFLSLLRSSLTDLFLQQINLTLNHSLFGDPSSFEILEFPGGITMIPERPASVMHVPKALFCFSLDSSIHDMKENLPELKEQLKSGLHLMPNEVVYIQVTSSRGSTKYPPAKVKASVFSGLGTLPPERLKKLAQIITGPTANLGLNQSVFGEVRKIRLSSLLNHSLRAETPTPSPSPAPSMLPCSNCDASMPPTASKPIPPPPHNLPRADSPESSEFGSPHCGSPNPSASPADAPQTWLPVERNMKELVPPLVLSSSPSSPRSSALTIRWNLLIALTVFLAITVIYDPSCHLPET